jgi:hypothetical protein
VSRGRASRRSWTVGATGRLIVQRCRETPSLRALLLRSLPTKEIRPEQRQRGEEEREPGVELHEVGAGSEEGQGVSRVGAGPPGDHGECGAPAGAEYAGSRQRRGAEDRGSSGFDPTADEHPGDACGNCRSDALLQLSLRAAGGDPDDEGPATAPRRRQNQRQVRRPGASSTVWPSRAISGGPGWFAPRR